MKPCFKCGETLPLSQFYRHPEMPDGHVNKCKECNKKDVRENYYAKHEQYRAYEQLRARTPKRKELNVKVTARMRQKFPEKYKAHGLVQKSVVAGTLQRQPCERCGSPQVHAHHEDYTRPLDVMWLCPLHHKERHKELKDMGITP